MKDIAELCGAFLAPVIALVTIYIAYQQYRTNRLKLKFDLFEKRFEVFETVFHFVTLIAAHEKPSAEDVRKLDQVKLTSHFIFGRDVAEYIHTVREKASSATLLDCRAKEIAQLGGGELLNNARRSQDDLLNWFDLQREECRRVFGPYLAMPV